MSDASIRIVRLEDREELTLGLGKGEQILRLFLGVEVLWVWLKQCDMIYEARCPYGGVECGVF
jgi:hypothetical protein